MGPLRCSVYVLLLAQLLPSHSHQSLRCLNDYINNITCVWESGGVPPAAVCTLHGVFIGLEETTEKCELKPLNKQDPSLRGCHLVFETKQFDIWTEIPIHVNCENVTDPVAQIQQYAPRLHIKMNTPGKPNITNYTISWSPGHPFSDVLPDYAFQLQFKQKDQCWEDVDPVSILDKKTQEQLSEEALEKGKSYQVRVRVGVPPQYEGYEGEWSHWSPITSWRSEVGRELTRGLKCLNDYINNITCVWESRGVPPAAVCTLHGVLIGLEETTEKCELKPLNKQDPSLRGCHLVFETKQFDRWTEIPIHVNCENVTDPVAQIQQYAPRLHIKMNPPGKPNITNYNISWSPGHPFSDILPDYAFQLQFKQKDQRWEDVDPVSILDKETQEQLSEEALEKGKSYQVRVRVGVPPQYEGYEGEWSHWSPITSWRSEVGRELTREVTRPPADTMKEKERMLIVCGAVLLVFLVAISITLPIRYIWVNKANFKPVPNPSKYFEVLNSIHGGNFQKWLSPVFSAQSFDVLQYSDDISHVEVFSAKDTSALFRKESAPASQLQGISGQSPSFSNLSYFYSSYPYKVEMHPVCSGDQPAEGAAEEEGKDRPGVTSAGSIQMDSSYESLQTLIDRRGEPIHPDSGIGVGSEDQEDTEDEGEGMGKGTAICSDPTAFLPFLCPFGKSPFHDPFPQHPSAFPQFPFPLPNKGAGQLVQPCSDEYMPVKEISNSSAGKCSEENTSK